MPTADIIVKMAPDMPSIPMGWVMPDSETKAQTERTLVHLTTSVSCSLHAEIMQKAFYCLRM